jgi:sodium transport system permease protein
VIPAIRVVFAKEVVDNLRDRRTFLAALLYPFLGPGMILLMIFSIGRLSREAELPLTLPVRGAEHAPNLIAFLKQNRVTIEPAPDDPEEAVRRGDRQIVLLVPEGYGEAFREGRPAVVQLVFDNSRNEALTPIQRAQALLEGYSTQMGRLRLQARGVDPNVVEALAVESVDVSTPRCWRWRRISSSSRSSSAECISPSIRPRASASAARSSRS